MINKVNMYPVATLLNSDANQVFLIPKYQREYTWATWQWEDLFDDLTENEQGYFLGSIICINTTSDTLNTLTLEVVDGQQRLTTLSLLLAALYSVFNEHIVELDEDQRADLRQLKLKIILKREPNKTRVVPQSQNNNLNDYLALLSEQKIVSSKFPMPKNAGNRRIFKAYNYFKRRISAYYEQQGKTLAALFDILDRVNAAIIVMIEVSNHADAYTLFESLNNRGTPLTAVDLIKNLLLARLDLTQSGGIDFYFEKWTQILTYIGDDYVVQERFFRHNYNAFRKEMNAPFINPDQTERQYPLGVIATRTNLLTIYEKVITADPEKFIDELSENASLYSTLLLRNQDDISLALRDSYSDLERCQGTPSYLLLLYLLKNRDELEMTDERIIRIDKLLVNFFVRRNLTDIPATRDLTRIFMALVEEIGNDKICGESILDLLRMRLIACSAADDVFEDRLLGPVYEDNVGATRFILCMLAKQGMTFENQIDLWKYNNAKQYVWTIEHIFPQGTNIPDCWVEMIANGDKRKAHEYQDAYVHTFGNLTISGYNSALGNKSFIEKKERKDANGNYVGYRNGLNLNADVVIQDTWTIETITKRTKRMVKEIVNLFQL